MTEYCPDCEVVRGTVEGLTTHLWLDHAYSYSEAEAEVTDGE